ncbi:MAG: S-layer homology domain-containing protein [Bacillota bacterium]
MRRLRTLLVLALAVALVLGTVGFASASTILPDVVGTKYEGSALTLHGIGVVKGTTAGTFEPLRTITRAEFAAMVVRAIGAEAAAEAVANQTPIFPDVNASWKWAWGYINIATSKGIIKGYPNGNFGPGDDVKYEEAITMLVRALGREAEALAAGAWPTGHIAVGTALGLTNDTDFVIGKPAIRGDLAIMTKASVYDVEDAQGKTLAGTVHAAKAVTSIIVSADKTATAVGSKVVFTATGYDARGNAIVVSPNWTVDDATGIINAKGEFVGTASKIYRVTATLGSVSGYAQVVVGAKATTIALSTNKAEINANGKGTATITAKMVDANGYVDPSYTGKVTFTLIGAGTLPSATQIDVVNGEATIVVTSKAVAGDIRVTANAPGVTGKYIDLKAVTPAATQVKTSTDFVQVGADGSSQTTITATLCDSDGVKVATNKVVTFTISNSDAFTLLTADADGNTAGIQVNAVNGVASLVLRAKTAPGSTAVTAAVAGLTSDAGVVVSSVITGVPNALVFVETPANVTVSNTTDTGTTVKVKLVDANGNICTNVTGQSVTLNITEKGTVNTSYVATTANLAQGVATFRVANTEVETLEYSASVTVGSTAFTTAAKVSSSFTVGAPAGVKVTGISPNVVAADGVATATVTAKIYDQFGNFVPTATNEVTFVYSGGTGSGVVTVPSSLTVNAVNGVATLTVTAKSVPEENAASFDATGKKADGTALANLTDANNTITSALFGVPDNLDIVVADATAGVANTVTVQVRDYLNRTITSLNGAPVSLVIATGEGTLDVATANTVAGVATFKFTSTKAQTGVTVKATYGSLTATSAGFAVAANVADRVVLTVNETAVAADGVSQISISAKEYDAYGNLKGANSAEVNLNNIVAGTGTLSDTTIVAGGSVTFTASTSPSTISLSAVNGVVAANGLPVTGTTISTYFVGAANKLAIVTPITETVADGATTQTVKVKVLDYNGNWLSGMTAGAGTVALAKNSGASAVINGDGSVSNGIATFTVTNTKAETVTYTATATGLTQSMATASFKAGPAKNLVVAASPTWIAADGVAQSLITVKVVDAQGNTANVSGTVTLTNSNTNSGTLSATTVTIANGVGTAPVTLNSKTTTGTCVISGSTTDITLADAGSNVTATVAVGTAVADYTVVPSTTSPTSGTAFTVAITAVDGNGITVLGCSNQLTLGETGTAAFTIGGSPIAAQTVTLVNGQATITVTGTGGATTAGTITVTDDTISGASATITLQ